MTKELGYMNPRHYSLIDNFIIKIDQGLKTLQNSLSFTARPYPAEQIQENLLSPKEKKHSAGLMRVNHAGEISAQGLYQGQALFARSFEIKKQMQESAQEENEHLQWCYKRLNELNETPSVLNPVWYGGSFIIGAFASALGDAWSLGFIVETEHQVIRHLDSHINQLPASDEKSKKILAQLKIDESCHAHKALQQGAKNLPYPIKIAMGLVSKIMTKTAYWV